MKYLSAPWRWKFITGSASGSKDCIFCRIPESEDAEGMILHRGKNFYTLLNKYPYSSGHLMIVPFRHLSEPSQMPASECPEMWEALQHSLDILRNSFHPQGFNIGMNIGQAAGAGVKGHFHLHVVPRWTGDANFMPIVGETRVVSYNLQEIYRTLKKAWGSNPGGQSRIP